MTDVLSEVAQVKSVLPRESQDPIVIKQTGQGYALMYLSFNSNAHRSAQITDYLTRVVQPKLQTLDGVGNAQILGGQTFAMRIWLDPDRMAAHGITPADVSNALATNNFTSAAGTIKGDYTQTSINALTSLDSAEASSQLVVATRGDSLIRLGSIAKVELGPQSVDSSAVFDGLKAVFVGVYATPEANPLTVIDNVRKAFPDLQAQLPPGLNAAIAYDATDFIRSSIDEVVKTLAEAAIIVIVVIFLFLGNLRSTLIPVVTIPLSLVGVMIMLTDPRLFDQSFDLARSCSGDRPRRRRRDRGGREHLSAHRRGDDAVRRRIARRTRDRVAGDRDDDHARRRLCADRICLRCYRRSVS